MSTTKIVPSRTITAAALVAEQGRRRNNKSRDVKVKAKSFILPALSADQMDAIIAGDLVTLTFKSGRVEHVALKV